MREDVVLKSSSTVRYGKGRTTAREVLGYVDAEPVTKRASRPVPQQEAHMRYPDTYDDPSRRRTTDGVDALRRSAATKAQPTLAQRKTYIPEPLPNRQQRRQAYRVQLHWSLFVGIGMIALLLLWFLASLIRIAYLAYVHNPATYGPAHGNTARIETASQHFYLEGMNDNGRTFILVVPDGDPEKSKLFSGPTVSKDAFVDLEIKDLNGDGNDDIVEQIVPAPGLLLSEPVIQDYEFVGDGKGNFKLQQP